MRKLMSLLPVVPVPAPLLERIATAGSWVLLGIGRASAGSNSRSPAPSGVR